MICYQNESNNSTSETAWTPMQPDDSPPSPEVLSRRGISGPDTKEMSRGELAEKLAQSPASAGWRQRSGQRKRNRYEVMFYQKVSLPWTSLIFVAFAIPLGVRPHRSSTSMGGVGLSVLFILIYYVLMTVGMIFGETGVVSAELAALAAQFHLWSGWVLLLLLDASRKIA